MASELPFDPCASPEVAACVRDIACAGPPLVTRIHPADEMYRFDLARHQRTPATAAVFYFSMGRDIVHTVSEIVAWRFGGWGAVRSFLDFACGYGRATRFLVRTVPPDRITAAEVDPGAVRFQQEAFGVRGCVSPSRPEALALPGPFDVVLVVSLFSHLPEETFEPWMRRLYDLVAEGGVLAFSTHGPDRLPPGETIPPSGIRFRPESETERLSPTEYGTSWVTEVFVREAASRASGGRARVFAHPQGLCGHQDLYVLARPPLPPGPGPRLSRAPLGALVAASVEDGVVRAGGWASGAGDEAPPEVELRFGERLEAVRRAEGAPGTRNEWSFSFPASAVSPDALVRIEAVSARGARRLLVAETLRPYLAAVAVEEGA